jgi:hypothetical protein
LAQAQGFSPLLVCCACRLTHSKMMAPQDMLMRLRKGNANEDELISMLADDAKKDPTESVAHKRDQDMWTPLHWAAQDGMLRLTVRLLGLGASANAADVCGATPLMIAAYNGHVGIVEALCNDRSTDVRQGNGFLNTACHYAAQRGQAACIEVLVGRGALVDVADKHGDSPLAWAARKGHLEAVHKLLELGADPLDDNNAGEDSIELATDNGHHAVAGVMEEALKEEERKQTLARYIELLDHHLLACTQPEFCAPVFLQSYLLNIFQKSRKGRDQEAELKNYDEENKKKVGYISLPQYVLPEGEYYRELQNQKDWLPIAERMTVQNVLMDRKPSKREIEDVLGRMGGS